MSDSKRRISPDAMFIFTIFLCITSTVYSPENENCVDPSRSMPAEGLIFEHSVPGGILSLGADWALAPDGARAARVTPAGTLQLEVLQRDPSGQQLDIDLISARWGVRNCTDISVVRLPSPEFDDTWSFACPDGGDYLVVKAFDSHYVMISGDHPSLASIRGEARMRMCSGTEVHAPRMSPANPLNAPLTRSHFL